MVTWIVLHASIIATLLEWIYRYIFLPIKLFIIYIITTFSIPF